MRRGWLTIALVAVVLASAMPVSAAEPVVSVWYRGTPAGVPRLDDLTAIRAAGFSGVTWPSATERVNEVSELAAKAGLILVLQPDTPALELAGRLRIDVTKTPTDQIPAIGWRAIARGIRTVSFDARQASGTGLNDADGRVPDWVPLAGAFSRQLSANAALFDVLQPAPVPKVSGPPAVEVTLAQSPRAWVVFATNAGDTPARAEVQLPARVPYAVWVSLIDGSSIGMIDRPDGARWLVTLEPGAAAVYVIDKAPAGFSAAMERPTSRSAARAI